MKDNKYNKLPKKFKKDLLSYIKENLDELKNSLEQTGLYITRNNHQITIHDNKHLEELLEHLEKI